MNFRYETKRMEIEKWLQRMESRLEQMGKIATTADVLEAQQKEQKVNNVHIDLVLVLVRFIEQNSLIVRARIRFSFY